MTVVESSLYADLHVETSPVQATAAWTDHIANVSNVSLSRGGREPYIGVSKVETGSGTITLVDSTATIEPGYWVRVRYSSTNIWAGYIQDVNTTYRFINGEEFAVTTLVVLDWVAWIAQFSFDSYAYVGPGWWTRLANINLQIDPAGNNKPIFEYPSGTGMSWRIDQYIGQTSVADILDLLANSIMPGGYWMANTTSPTGSTSGLDSLVTVYNVAGSSSITGAFTDGTHTGSPSSLTYYNDIEMVKQTSAVANNVVIANQFANSGEMLGVEWADSDATSIATYGSRLATVDTNITGAAIYNLVSNPSLAFSTDYLFSGAGNMIVNRSTITDVATGATNYLSSGATQPTTDGGDYIAVGKINANQVSCPFVYGGPEYNGNYSAFVVTPSTQYTASAYLRGGVGQSSMTGLVSIRWYDDAGAIISTSSGTATTVTSTAWNRRTVTATSPATARTAVVIPTITFGGGNNTGNRYFCTGVQMETGASASTWFSGATIDTTTYLYGWLGSEGGSTSFRINNYLDTLATDFLTDNKTPKYSPLTMRFNAQANLTASASVDLYKNALIWRDAHRWSSIVTGIDHEISINADGTTRWMIELTLRPSNYTI